MFEYRKATLFAIALIRAGVISFFLAQEGLDLRYLTYLNYTMTTAFLIFLLYSTKSVSSLRATLIGLFPIVFNTCLFIGVAIVIIVQLNDWVFTRTTVVHHGPRRVGEVHTGDWILHQLPVVEMFVIMVMYLEDIRSGYKDLRKGVTKLGAGIYYAHTVAFPSMIILLYFATEDINRNYPVEGLANWVKVLMSLVFSWLVGLFFLLLVHPFNKLGK